MFGMLDYRAHKLYLILFGIPIIIVNLISVFGIGFIAGSFLQFLGLAFFLKSFGVRRRFIFSKNTFKILFSGLFMALTVYILSLINLPIVWSLILQILTGVFVYGAITIYSDVFEFSDICLEKLSNLTRRLQNCFVKMLKKN